MISINRISQPNNKRKNNPASLKYNNDRVVKKLWKMQNGKCCYCEQYIPYRGGMKHVEHIKPRKDFENLINEWDNLLLACPQCNINKSSHYPYYEIYEYDDYKIISYKKIPLIIDPSDNDVNPKDHITYHTKLEETILIGHIIERNNSEKGKKTIEIIGLDEEYYTGERRRHLLQVVIFCFLNLIESEKGQDDRKKEIIKEQFKNLLETNSKYSGLVREFGRQHEIEKNYGIEIPNGTK